MITRLSRFLLIGAMLIGVGGCAVLLVGAGAAGGYAISQDSIKNDFDLPFARVFRVSRDVVKETGLVTLEDDRRGLITAVVEGADVTVSVKRISQKTVELKVKARQLLLPKFEIAQTIYNHILDRLQ